MYKGPGIESAELTFTDTAGVDTVVQQVTGTEADGVIPISYTPPYTEQKSGTLTLKVAYTGFPVDEDALLATQTVNVHSK